MAYGMYQDPNQGWYGNVDEYGYPYQYEEVPEEDTESQKLRKEQEMIEAIESNRLYLRKVKKRCVQEDFADLEKTQMFLFEFLIETLEVNADSDLGLVPESDEPSELVARVQFLDTPYLEIREKGEKIDRSDSVMGQTEYLEVVGNAGLKDALDPGRNGEPGRTGEMDKVPLQGTNEEVGATSEAAEPPTTYDTKWENSSGKSLLFSKSALEIIQGLDKSPVKVQISRCVESTEEEGKGKCEPLGYALVRLPDHFSLSVLQSCKPGVVLPVSCVHRDACQLRNVFGAKKGELQVFVRLSCFGSVITTSFQSVGPERRYVFKPSPLPDLQGTEESEVNRDTVLKPIVADEEVAKGITTIVKDEDVFQKTVLWKNNPQNCGCLDVSSDMDHLSNSSPRMPRPSDVALCRDANPAKQTGQPYCQWHDLVSKEIKNNPGGNCGCLDNVKTTKVPPTVNVLHSEPQVSSKSKPSRIEKLGIHTVLESRTLLPKLPEKGVEPINGLGIPPEPRDCNCDCARIRNSLAIHPMMKYTWEVK